MPRYMKSRNSRKYQKDYYYAHKIKSHNPSHRPVGEGEDPATRKQRIKEWMDKINGKELKNTKNGWR